MAVVLDAGRAVGLAQDERVDDLERVIGGIRVP
jgi:hypothetical protein